MWCLLAVAYCLLCLMCSVDVRVLVAAVYCAWLRCMRLSCVLCIVVFMCCLRLVVVVCCLMILSAVCNALFGVCCCRFFFFGVRVRCI